ncbi:hypothetical protein TNCV_5007631 [Trichonephila clavipes]|nr:hypothetical protein TNCV_5007631 [Trichonephila clavipes]
MEFLRLFCEFSQRCPVAAVAQCSRYRSDRGWPCHEFEPSTTKSPLCGGGMHVKSVESSNVLPLVWYLGEGRQLRCRLRHLTMAQNYVVRRQKPSSS